MSTTIDDIKASNIPVWEKGSQDDFERWILLIEMRLREKDCVECMTQDWGDSSKEDDAKKKKDVTARCLILTKTKGVAFKMIKNIKSCKAMLEKLKDRYQGSQEKNKRGNDLLEDWTKATTMTSNEYGNPNAWMEVLTNLAIDLEDCDAEFKKSEREIMVTMVNGLPEIYEEKGICLLYTSPSPRDGATSRMPSSA